MSQVFSQAGRRQAFVEEPLLPQAIERGIELIRIDPTRNMYRYYTLRYEQDLFGQWVLIRQWGRIGRSQQVWRSAVNGPNEAVLGALGHALAKLRAGYRLRSEKNYPQSAHIVSKSWPGRDKGGRDTMAIHDPASLAAMSADHRTGEATTLKPGPITLTRKEIDALLTVAGNADAVATFEDCREPDESPVRLMMAYDRAVAKLRRAYATA